MDVLEKLTILTDSAKYDVACTSSGSERPGDETGLGSTVAAGLCHAFAADGRCISLLKVLLSNCCVYDCKYCVNRVTNDVPRAAFTPRELADLTIGFYRRNYIEGLFLSSAVLRSPDYTMEQMIGVLELLRGELKPFPERTRRWWRGSACWRTASASISNFPVSGAFRCWLQTRANAPFLPP